MCTCESQFSYLHSILVYLDSWERFDASRLGFVFGLVNVELDKIDRLVFKMISRLIKSWSDQFAWATPGSGEINNDWVLFACLNDMRLPFGWGGNLEDILGCHHHDGASRDVALALGHMTEPS